MRRFLAIFFLALLAVVQVHPGIASALSPRPAESSCKCCDCGGTGCCVTQSTSDPQPVAPCPGWSSLQLTQFLFLRVLSSEVTASAVITADFPAPRESGSGATAIPLFQRYCSFLI